MPNESGAAQSRPDLPADLRADYLAFSEALAHWVRDRAITPEVLQLLVEFGLLVHERAERLAIIAKGDRSTLLTRHVLDSLNPISLFESPPKTLLDLGSGGGFPGIPLAIVWPGSTAILLESRDKKVGFLEHAVRTVGLKNVTVVGARLEDAQGRFEGREPDAVFLRALGDLPKMLRLAQPLAAPRARWVYFLGESVQPPGLVASLGALGADARVAQGEFGGRLLHGTFFEHVSRETSG